MSNYRLITFFSYAVDEAVYSLKVYPEHCAGMAYLLSFDAVRSLSIVALSNTIPLISVDDAFVGILRARTSIKLHKLNFFYTLSKAKMLDCVGKFGRNCQIFVGLADHNRMDYLWKQIAT
jgi:hypothetical protein